MSFRCRQKYHSAPCGCVIAFEEKTLETGVVDTVSVNQSEKVLPKPELFDLADNLKAGVNLQETSSKILGTDTVSLDSVLKPDDEVLADDKSNSNKEVNNEN